MSRKNVVPFRPPESFKRFGIDWTREAANYGERTLREAYLTYELSCGQDGLVSILLLAIVSRRQGAVPVDLQASAEFAEVMLSMTLRKHRDDAVEAVHRYVTQSGTVWT
ncbi:MAG TPA: hypothetical protein VGU66_17450 [Candidatus Elarobacter sp.]|nr:hypothetical protein [Candidatus Elarobacter sp.]